MSSDLPEGNLEVMHGLFITGTDTEVGKTHVTCEIARTLSAAGSRVGLYKPVCSGGISGGDGTIVWDDLQRLNNALPEPVPVDRICPQRFVAPLAPPVAAREEGRTIDEQLLRTGIHGWDDAADVLLVEGVGGLLCPLTDRETVADLAVDFGFPLLIVSPQRLGTINHTLMTVEVARSRGLHVAGIVMNHVVPPADDSVASNAAEIASRAGVPVIAELPYHPSLGLPGSDPDVKIDWWKVIRATADTEGAVDSND
ncbi:ATP-dependent dethiobiotin synthetase BioD 1 [Maioricimonas rarisocia]|uniref:ATP-dependent dethiobiotin synthetase BioD n=1 Tax=Maioricimonas rarisocia TaxID=2528026 RepID=A0A517ZCS1_9PLAN|nr:dethiobiotin synthase [Maioricimonas rarisocia]QDU40265.1 ATP-dependent dethiobiotin synthetase BioD 1 [Maioricimonas rarisocia]